MNRVDKLNRQYKKLLETYEELECMGPLEATVKSLQKDIDAVSETVLRVWFDLPRPLPKASTSQAI